MVVLFAAVTFVLLIGCLNIAMLLGKSVARTKELALRAALGSGRARLARQLLTEALLLSGAGAALGILLAMVAVHYFRALNPIAMPPGNPVAINFSVLAFTASLAVATALIFGLVPALKASRVDLMDALRVSARNASAGRTAHTIRGALVIAEVTLSVALLSGSGLLIQSVGRLASVPLGFPTDGVLSMSITLPKWAYPAGDQRARFYRAALDRIAVLPEVVSAAWASSLPPDGRFGANSLAISGRPEPSPATAAYDIAQVSISSGYFRVMGIPLERGRVFDDADNDKAAPVALVNQALAREYFAHEDPIGKRVRVGAPDSDRPWLTIVGVAADEKDHNFFHQMSWEEIPTVFRPVSQDAPSRLVLVLRGLHGSSAVAAAIQKQIAGLDATVPVSDAQTMNQRVSRALSYPRLRATILSVFAAHALLLAAIGLYAVLAQLTAQRMQEFGVRMALGAQRSDLLGLVLREGMVLTFAGLVIGLIVAVCLTKMLSSLLYAASIGDPLTLTGVCLALAAATLLATCIPARRAARVDPIVALRYE